ncbi:MAG: hypothetical protein AVDCRST_MAG05-222, partial [uncultured Rubrobacteraceae bacterium]
TGTTTRSRLTCPPSSPPGRRSH